MKIDSKYTKIFVSDNITDLKYDQLLLFAVSLCEFKNKISEEVSKNLLKYLNMNKNQFITHFRSLYPKYISSYFDAQLYTLIYTCYDNKFDNIKNQMKFLKRIFKSFNFYKKDIYKKVKDEDSKIVKKLINKKGDLKSVSYETKNTNLSITLTYLARYGSENIFEYIKSVYNLVDGDKQKYYDNILSCIDKFGFERLYKLALLKRNRIIKKYNKKPISFKSLTFSGKTSCIKQVVGFNKNYNSCINAFVSINLPFRNGMDIPVKYAKLYHGSLKDYKKQNNKKNQYCYTISFDTYKKYVKILFCIDKERELPDNKLNYIGIDVNLKHNLFCLSDGTVYDYDRKLIDEYICLLNEVDVLLSKNKDYIVGKKRLHKLDIYRDKVKKSNQRLISDICKDLNNRGIDHVVMENLDNSFKKSYIKDKEHDEKYTRISHILNIGSLKDEFKHIAVNYDISVSFVNAEYTSLMCPVCGCITKANRENQEEFKCVHCDHTDNADHNAAINIKNRVKQTVFADALLKQNIDNTYLPKKLSHDKVKKLVCQCVMELYHTNEDDIDII